MTPQSDLFTSLYEQHYHRVRERACYLLGNVHEAEEVAQETFLSAWRHKDKLTPERAYSFLYTIVTNKCVDVIRHRKHVSFVDISLFYSLEEPLPDMADGAENVLEKAINELPERERMMFSLVGQDYQYAEIAAMTGKSLSACKMIFYRSRPKLWQKYVELLEGAA